VIEMHVRRRPHHRAGCVLGSRQLSDRLGT
jgi:hypothetical protein